MHESKDSAIKLFGKKIPLPADKDSPGIYGDELPVQALERELVADEEETESDKDLQPTTDGSDAENDVVSTTNDDPETDEKKQSEEKQTTLKKPDKILPCPRCNSMDTKFCYYNNYNVNQPRHFCKACQRYWTAGGTMRNVPVGAGRRKNKNSVSAAQYHHVTISEALHATAAAARPPPPRPNGHSGVLSFSNLSNANANATHTGIDDCSSASSVTVSNSAEEAGGNGNGNGNGMDPNAQSVNIPCIQAVPWPPYGWNSAGPHGFPMPFYPFWNYAASAAAAVPGGAWNIPWFPPPPPPPFCPSNAPALGKHPRELDLGGGEEAIKRRNGAVLVPKTLRFDDPIEAAKSSIWATLGIKNEGGGVGMFKAFQGKSDGEKKGDKRSNIVEPSLAHMANPAAMSRSLNFHETA